MAGPGQGMPMQMGNPSASQMTGMQFQQVQQQSNMGMPLGPPGTVQHGQHPGPPQVQHQHPHPTQPDQRLVDPIARFRTHVPRLKDSLATLFKAGGNLFNNNARQDETGAQIENVTEHFEKRFEEFYAICDQVEICLRLAHEIIQQDTASKRNTPASTLPSSGAKDGQQLEGQAYAQYLTTVRAQIGCAKEIRDLLHDCLNNLHEHPHS